MNTTLPSFSVVALLLLLTPARVWACNLISEGLIQSSGGEPLNLGFDRYGYNYQAREFQGLYQNVTRPEQRAKQDMAFLQLHWSDSWLSNRDCDHSGQLDRAGYLEQQLPESWFTYAERGSYLDHEQQEHRYTYFAKVVIINGHFSCDPRDQLKETHCISLEVLNDPSGLKDTAYFRKRIVSPHH